VGSGKLDQEDLGGIHPRSVLAVSKAVGIGDAFSQRDRKHNEPV
jgi:hypothetical protein